MTKHNQRNAANDALPDFTRSLNVLNTKTPAENPFLQSPAAQSQTQKPIMPATSQGGQPAANKPISSNE